MFFQIELLYLVAMLATFVVLITVFKIPSGICLMASAFVGIALGAIFSGTDFTLRFFIEGATGYLDALLTICAALIFVGLMQQNGGFDYLSALLVKGLRKVPSLLLIVLMIIVMFPAMVTGSCVCSVLTTGLIVKAILEKWGLSRTKAAAFVIVGGTLGEICPPINLCAMVICDGVDMPYSGFELPLLALCIPLAIVAAIFIGRKYVRPLDESELDTVVDTNVLKELKWTVLIPLLMVILFIILEMVFRRILGIFTLTLMFFVASIVSLFFGRKMKFASKDKEEKTVVTTVVSSLKSGYGIIALLMGVGMFMAAIALNGVRGWLVTNCLLLPGALQIIVAVILLPVVGGISSFGSSSMIAAPFIMSLYQRFKDVFIIGGFSMFAAIGDFLPPSAIGPSSLAEKDGERNYFPYTKECLPMAAIMFVYSAIFTFVFGRIAYQDATLNEKLYVIFLAVMVVLAVIFTVVYEVLLHNGVIKNKNEEINVAKEEEVC